MAAILDQLAATRERWTREKHAAALPPSDEELHDVRERALNLSRRQ